MIIYRIVYNKSYNRNHHIIDTVFASMLKCLHHTIGNPAPDKANQRYC